MLAIPVLASAAPVAWGQDLPALTKAIAQQYCRPTDDDLGGTRDAHLRVLRDAGETGRLALLRVVASDPANSNCALGYLVDLGDRRAIPYLRASLQDASNPDVAVALTGLARLQDRESFEQILSYVGDPDASRAAVLALGLLDDERARAALRELMTAGRVAPSLAVRAMGWQRDASATQIIVRASEAAAARKDWLTVSETVTALARIRTVESLRLAEVQFKAILPERWRILAKSEAETALHAQLDAALTPEEQRAIQEALSLVGGWRDHK